MYTLALRRTFLARHYLIGGDWGSENQVHAHAYRVEVQIEGTMLDQHGYLVDLVEVEHCLNALVAHYDNRVLNDLEEFAGLNPSLEHFARHFCDSFCKRVEFSAFNSVTVRLWENENAWVAYRQDELPA